MPKYYCDYCDTYLTHDSPSVRKTHCSGRKHKDNVRDYYQTWMEEQAQKLINKTTEAFQQQKQAASVSTASLLATQLSNQVPVTTVENHFIVPTQAPPPHQVQQQQITMMQPQIYHHHMAHHAMMVPQQPQMISFAHLRPTLLHHHQLQQQQQQQQRPLFPQHNHPLLMMPGLQVLSRPAM